jgi:two-component system sensor histidine kinase/response regulator
MKRILIIDDEEFLRGIIRTTLRRRGFETLESDNGADGVRLARQQLPDLIICDVRMDRLDGYGTLASLRNEPATAAIPFILMTGQADSAGMRQGMALGADDYLAKPFTLEELLTTVNARLKKRQAIQHQVERRLDELRTNINLALPHELLTPLNGILGLAEVIRTCGAALPGEQITEMAVNIQTAANQLHRVIQNFLIHAQIELVAADPRKVESLRREQTPQVQEAIQALAMQKAEAANRQGDLIMTLTDAAVGVSRDYLLKIAEELLDNAFKFSGRETPVQVTTRANANSVTLSVSDVGRGMTPEQIADVGAFSQFDRNRQAQAGLGLGLSIVKRLTELHGGELILQSEPKAGTTATVTLPKPAGVLSPPAEAVRAA